MALVSPSTSALPSSSSPYDLSASGYSDTSVEGQHLRQGNLAHGGMRGTEVKPGSYTSSSRVASSSASARTAATKEEPVFLQTKTRSWSTPAKAQSSSSPPSPNALATPSAPFTRPNRAASPSPSSSSGRRAPHPQQRDQHQAQFSNSQPYPLNGSQGFPSQHDAHQFPHPQYPFIPSPHGNSYQGGPGPFSPGFPVAGSEAQYQHQAMLLQQAQYQQQQWQMEMMRNQQVAAANYAAQYGAQQQGQSNSTSSRRRTSSGPGAVQSAQKPNYYNSPPLPYPTSPLLVPMYSTNNSQSAFYRGQSGTSPGQVGGYPTPPGSTDGREAHPNHPRGSPNESHPRSQSPHPKSTKSPSPVSQPSSSSMSSIPSTSSNQSTSTSATSLHKKSDSSVSLSIQNFPPLPKSTLPLPASASPARAPSPSSKRVPVRKLATSSPPNPTQVSSSLAPPPLRIRTESSTSSNSSRSSARPDGERRGPSSPLTTDDNSRSSSPATSVSSANAPVVNGKRPSPLSQQVDSIRPVTPSSERERERPGTPGTVRGKSPAGYLHGDDGEDSDDTASGTVVAPSTLGKEKERPSMKTKFKKAFSLSHSTSSSTITTSNLSERDLDGNGPSRMRSDSVGSMGSSPPLTPILDTPSASSATSSKLPPSNKPPTASSSRRFGILNSKMNSSTDNLSISSTVSSASVMIRKLGQLGGKLTRRASLMSLTKAFKSKDKDETTKGSKLEVEKSRGSPTKGSPALANVSHVTAEVESAARVGVMSPAAALAKKHQQQYADQEAAAAAAAALAPPRSFAVHARTGSNASDAGSMKSARTAWGNKSKEDVTELGGSTKSRAMLEKEKEKLKSRKVRKWGLGFGSKSEAELVDIIASGSTPSPPVQQGDDSQRQDEEILMSPPRAPGMPGSAFDDSSVEFEIQSIAPGDDDYEPSLRGVMPLGPRKDARAVRGILKGAGTYNQEDFAPPPSPTFPRPRADSSTSPQVVPRSPSLSKIPSQAQLDGLVRGEVNQQPISHGRSLSHSTSVDLRSSPYAHPSMNVSAPTFNSAPFRAPAVRAASSGTAVRRIVFAQNLSVHTTWPATVYDRRAEPATCNRLTPTLAQRIKEELNAYKMEEMDVHPTSRQLTHFFV